MQDCKDFGCFTIYSSYCEKKCQCVKARVETTVECGLYEKTSCYLDEYRCMGSGSPMNNICHHCTQKCKLKHYFTKKKPNIRSVQKRRQVLWAWARVRWTDESTFQLVFRRNGHQVPSDRPHWSEEAQNSTCAVCWDFTGTYAAIKVKSVHRTWMFQQNGVRPHSARVTAA